MNDNPAVFWAAVSAIMSAVAAFATVCFVFIARLNLLEANRPQLVPTEWSRTEEGQGKSKRDVVRFEKVQNVGRGAALTGFVEQDIKNPSVIVHGGPLPIVVPGDHVNVKAGIAIYWYKVPAVATTRSVSPQVSLHFWDTAGIHYETTLSFLVLPLEAEESMPNELVDKVVFLAGHTKRRSRPRQRFISRSQQASRWIARQVEAIRNKIGVRKNGA